MNPILPICGSLRASCWLHLAVLCWFAFQCAALFRATVLAHEKRPISASLRPLDIYIYVFGSQSCATRLVFVGSARRRPKTKPRLAPLVEFGAVLGGSASLPLPAPPLPSSSRRYAPQCFVGEYAVSPRSDLRSAASADGSVSAVVGGLAVLYCSACLPDIVRPLSGQRCSPARNGRFARPCDRSTYTYMSSGRSPARLVSFSQVPPGCGPKQSRASHLWSSSARCSGARPHSRSLRRRSRRLRGDTRRNASSVDTPPRLATCLTAHPTNRVAACRSVRHSPPRLLPHLP